MKQYFVYILECSDKTLYVGITNNLEGRLWEHQNGVDRTAYTFRRRPVKLVFSENFDNPTDAISFEKQVKGWRKEKKAALINGEWEKLPALSKSYRTK